MSFRVTTLRNTPDLQRILSLPRRTLRKSTAAKHAAHWTERLAIARGAELRPWQGQGLHEVVKFGGLLGSLPVGQGKTILCETIPVALAEAAAAARAAIAKFEGKRGAGGSRSVLIAPSVAEDKTYSDRRSFAGVWRMASPPPRFTSRESLQGDANAYLLQTIDPEIILIDEADELSNFGASTPTRIDRFVKAKRARGKAAGLPWPHGCWVVAMTGTPTRNSILGYWHILRWCLGDFAPVPASRAEAELWALALDNKSPRSGFRPHPGPLGATLKQAREWYLDRLDHTPGVMLVDEDSAEGIPLRVRFKIAPECPKIDDAFERLRTLWESPSGEPVSDALSMLRIESQAGCGIYTYWKPPPPQEWIDARREVAAYIRKRIADTRHALKPLDTDAQVIRAHPDAKYYCKERKRTVYPVREWLAVRKMFDPLKSSRVKWLSDATLQRVARWIDSNRKKGRVCLVWCGSVEFGVRLAEVAGVPYYGREGKERTTRRGLHEADPRKSMVCSWHANKRIFNLQDWREHAIVYPPPSAKYLEQMFGRSHRSPKPGVKLHLTPVNFTVFLTSGGTLDSFRKAVSEAQFAKDTAKSTQKILRADIEEYPELPEGLRWVQSFDDRNE
jgi:hypothetical protein